MIEQTRPRGRHRAPTRHSSTALRVSAAVAVSGGLVATMAGPADAAQGSAQPMTPQEPVVAAAPNVLTVPATGGSAASVSVGQVRLPKVVEARDLIKQLRERTATATTATASAPVQKRVSRSVATKVTRRTTTETKDTSSSSSRTTSSDSSKESSSSSSTTAERVLAIAKRYIGTPYEYGGTTPGGFDCSGFTSYVFRQIGIDLPRTARTQQSVGYRVSEPRPGDLVFSGYPATHVAIYVGNGMVIDSPKPGGEVNIHKNWSGTNFRRVL